MKDPLIGQLVRAVRRVGDHLESLQQDVSRATSAQHQAANSQPQQQPPIQVRSDLSLPVAVTEYCEAENRDRKSTWRKVKTGLEIAGVFLLLLTVSFTGTQWWEMRDQSQAMRDTLAEAQKQTKSAAENVQAAKDGLKESRDNFAKDQRPYIYLTNDIGEPRYVAAAKQVIWQYHFANFGKSPAVDVEFDRSMRIGKETAFEKTLVGRGSPMPPTTSVDNKIAAFSKSKIENDEFGKLLSIDDGISVRGSFRYKDLSGNRYETTFCLYRLATGAIAFCESAMR